MGKKNLKIDLNVITKTKNPQKKKGAKIHDNRFGNGSLDMTLKTQTTK